jgi:cobalt transporter subunit CbtB
MSSENAYAAATDDRVEVVIDKRKTGAALFVLAFGLFLVWGAAYANPITLHNAAHDARHAFAFPCH